jgi:spermidine synthase
MQLGVLVLLLAPLAVWCFSFSRRPVRFGLALGMVLLAIAAYRPDGRGVLVAHRTFFGVLRVHADVTGMQHVLMHGNTVHGEQRLDPARRREPLTYYHRSGPIGQVIEASAARLRDAHVGVVGLGAGSLAAYAQPGQQWTFFEIDPAVARIAHEPSLFTYLHDCGAACDVVLGDARLSLGRQTGPAYQLLVLDAFSSDAIPVHLMTREAVALYLGRLEPDGILAFHISNRHLSLRPVLAALAAEQGLAALVRKDARSDEETSRGQFPSEWFLMARRVEMLRPLDRDSRWVRPAVSADTRIWTDDYSDILSALESE